jgi:hypothetical protein
LIGYPLVQSYDHEPYSTSFSLGIVASTADCEIQFMPFMVLSGLPMKL